MQNHYFEYLRFLQKCWWRCKSSGMWCHVDWWICDWLFGSVCCSNFCSSPGRVTALKMEAALSCNTSVTISQYTRCHIPWGLNLQTMFRMTTISIWAQMTWINNRAATPCADLCYWSVVNLRSAALTAVLLRIQSSGMWHCAAGQGIPWWMGTVAPILLYLCTTCLRGFIAGTFWEKRIVYLGSFIGPRGHSDFKSGGHLELR